MTIISYRQHSNIKEAKRKNRIILSTALNIVIDMLAITIGCNYLVNYNADDRLYDDVISAPHRKVGLLLGTTP